MVDGLSKTQRRKFLKNVFMVWLMTKTARSCFAICAFIGFGLTYIIYYLAISFGKNTAKLTAKSAIEEADPWYGIPEFTLYVRFTSGDRWEQEYRDILIRTMRLFFPPERARLVAVLDGEKDDDHNLGDMIAREWPFPKICYSDEGDRSIYHNKGKSRMYWDMFYPDKCTKSEYVGFVDTDTFFSTFVTPSLLFEHGKPIIVAKIGKPTYACWEAASEIFLGKKEILQCMSTFPLMVKNEHIQEMRKKLAADHDKSFDAVFRDAPIQAGGAFCICQFSIMCNYFWYYHRNEYSWHVQSVPGSHVKKSDLLVSMASLDYYRKVITPKLRIPIPRPSIHIRYLMLNGIRFEQQEPPPEVMEGFIREGLCYSAGFTYCKESCKMYDRHKIHKNLFSFEFYNWLWDKRCLQIQKVHYHDVNELIDYYLQRKKDIFGLRSINNLCSLIEANEPYEI